jgi:hypothetical protein
MKVLLSIVIAVIFGNCFQSADCQTENHLTTFDLKDLSDLKTIKLSELGVVDIDYIPLETNEQSFISGNFDMISMGSRIIAEKDYFIIKNFNKIKKFNSDGSFVATIGKVGRGPDEFLTAHDIDVNRKNHEVFVVDAWEKKFFVYSGNGDFIRTFPCPINTNGFRFTSDGILCYSTDYMGNIKNSYNLIDNQGKIIKVFPNKYPWELKSKNAPVLNDNIFYEFNNQIFKKEIYSDTIYVYNSGTFKPHLVIEHGERLLTTKTRSNLDLSKPSNFIFQENIFEFGDYVFYEFSERSKYSFWGSKNSNYKALSNNKLDLSYKRFKGFVNDIDCGPSLLPYAVKTDNTLVCIFDALSLKKYIESQAFKNAEPKYPEKKRELERLANNLKEDDNPVLILIKFKQ